MGRGTRPRTGKAKVVPKEMTLVDNFNIMPISTPEEDLKAILGQAA